MRSFPKEKTSNIARLPHCGTQDRPCTGFAWTAASPGAESSPKPKIFRFVFKIFEIFRTSLPAVGHRWFPTLCGNMNSLVAYWSFHKTSRDGQSNSELRLHSLRLELTTNGLSHLISLMEPPKELEKSSFRDFSKIFRKKIEKFWKIFRMNLERLLNDLRTNPERPLKGPRTIPERPRTTRTTPEQLPNGPERPLTSSKSTFLKACPSKSLGRFH